MNPIKVLIVEDELIIAESIKLYLSERGHITVGMAISYEQAITLIHAKTPELVLIDIRIYGEKSGIDVAEYLNGLESKITFVILSSQYDQALVSQAAFIGASGYLTKPITKGTLWSTVEMVAQKATIQEFDNKYVEVKIRKGYHRISLNEILYIKSDHVYVEIVCENSKFLCRYSLSELIENINHPDFVRCHRSYAVNSRKITTYTSSKIWIGEAIIPVSAKYRTSLVA